MHVDFVSCWLMTLLASVYLVICFSFLLAVTNGIFVL